MNTTIKLPTLILIGVIVLGFGIFIANNTGSADPEPVARYGAGNQASGHQHSHNTDAEHTEGNCVSDDCLYVDGIEEYPTGELTQGVEDALDAAIDDEYKARAVYDSVMDNIGALRPFSMIIRAEEQHISALKSLYDKYGLVVPSDPYSNLDVADNKEDNCAIGVQAEIDNAALYRNQLLPAVEGHDDITSVFTKLMDASQDKHLPAFERCAP